LALPKENRKVSVCVCERERERERGCEWNKVWIFMKVSECKRLKVCVCVRNCSLFHFIVYSGSLCKNCISFSDAFTFILLLFLHYGTIKRMQNETISCQIITFILTAVFCMCATKIYSWLSSCQRSFVQIPIIQFNSI
jgi:hypothetical protein